MALIKKICILDYVPYKADENLQLGREDFMVPPSLRPYLETIQAFGVRLEYDGCMSQGLNIVSRTGQKVGHVQVFMEGGWLDELQKDLEELARNPEQWGLIEGA